MALTELLEAYLATVEAKDDFLTDAAAIEAIAAILAEDAVDAEDPTNEEIEAAIADYLTDARGDLNGFTAVGTTTTVLAGDSDRVVAAKIEQITEDLEEAVADAQEDVNDVRGLNGRIDTLLNRKSQLEASAEAATKLDVALNAEIAKFEVATADLTVGDLEIVYGTAGERGTFAVRDATTTAEVYLEVKDGKVVVGETGKGLAGIDALLAAGQALYSGLVSADTALTNFETALLRVVQLEAESEVDGYDGSIDDLVAADYYTQDTSGPGGVWGVDGDGKAEDPTIDLEAGPLTAGSISQTLIDARLELSAFQVVVEAYLEAKSLSEQLEALEDDIDDALDALEDAGFFVTVVDDSVDGTIEDDVFLYVEDTEATGLEITNFSDEGSDVLYVGDAFAQLTRLEDEADLSAERLGSNDVREIFVQQDGNNTILFIEAEAAAGGDRNLDEITTITLTGVNADDLVLENGFISIA